MASRAASPLAIPRLTGTSPAEILAWSEQFGRAVQLELERIARAAGAAPYVVSNPTPTRTLNAAAPTLAQTTNALATALQDLQAKGVLA